MTLQVKERIVGVVVIVCLLLIWGPFFLNKKSSEQAPKKDENIAARSVSDQVQIASGANPNRQKLEGTQLVDNSLPPQTPEEQLQPKQPPVLPMPTSQTTTKQQNIEDEDIAPEPTLEWSGPGANKAKPAETKPKPESNNITIPDEDQQETVTPVQPAPEVHDKESQNEVNDEKMLKTSEANEAKLKKLFEKNEQMALATKKAAVSNHTKVAVAKPKPVVATVKTPREKSLTHNKAKETIPVVSANAATKNKWIVEVATLSNPHYVAVLKQKLAKNGFTAFSREGRSGNGNPIFYIWIGAENNREQAEMLAKRLEQTSRMSGKVMKSSNVG